MKDEQVSRRGIPEATVARLPVYLRALGALAERDTTTVSSEELAVAAGVNSAKLRKDLSHLGSYGVRGVGYDVDVRKVDLSTELQILAFHEQRKALARSAALGAPDIAGLAAGGKA